MPKLPVYVLLLCAAVISSVLSSNIVAVCVTGQPGRLQPEFLLRSVVNANPSFTFKIFYFLQRTSTKNHLVYNTGLSGKGFKPSRFESLSDSLFEKTLTLLFSSAHSSLEAIKFVQPVPLARWNERMRNSSLDRIHQYVYTQDTVLNMYDKQIRCAEHIRQFEISSKSNISMVINTREDVYFYHDVNLTSLYLEYVQKGCGVVTRNCLSWDGLNMRFQLYGRDQGMAVLASRLDFYKSMYASNMVVGNTEQFEAYQMQQYQIKRCPVSVDLVPATVARHTTNGKFCFIYHETGCESQKCKDSGASPCYPEASKEFVQHHQCGDYR